MSSAPATDPAADSRARPEPDPGAGADALGLSDGDVLQMERSLRFDQVRGVGPAPAQRRPASPEEQRLRRQGDVELVEALRATGFRGRLFDLFQAEYAEYGCRIMFSLLRSGEIIGRCARMPPHRPRPLPISETPRWSDDDIREMADETVALALRVFADRALREGGWDPNGPASLRTYFVNCCVLQFPNVFAQWSRRRRNWEDNALLDRAECASASVPSAAGGGAAEWSDPTAAGALGAVMREELLRSLKPRERIVMELRARGHSQAQIAGFLDVPVTTVRGVVERVRHRAKGNADRWRDE